MKLIDSFFPRPAATAIAALLAVAILPIGGLREAVAQDAAAPAAGESATGGSSEGADPEAIARIDEALSGTVGPGWILNYRLALEKAKTENKDLLLLFTGSDWVDLCKKFDMDVLLTDEFFKVVSENFVLVRMDFPRNERQNEALRAQNQMMMVNYRVQGFPTVLLTDTAGRPYAMNGYQAVSAKEYATILTSLTALRVTRDEKLAAAESAEGLEKAKLLAEGIPNLPGNRAAWFYRAEMQALIANDLKDQTGRAVHFQRLINDVDYSRTMAELSRNVEWSKMLSLTDDYIRGNQLKGEELQHAMLNKVSVLRSQGKVSAMVQTLLEIVAVDPKTKTGVKAQEILDQMRISNLQQGITPAAEPEQAKP